MTIMRQSRFLQIIKSNKKDDLLCYHSLYGAGNVQYLYNSDYVETLLSFSSPREISSSDDEIILKNLSEVGFLIDDSVTRNDERKRYDNEIKEWVSSLEGGGKVTYLNLYISEKCNFSCPHCSQVCTDKSISFDNDSSRLMSWEIAQKSIDSYWENICIPRGLIADIHFGSDEPLLNWGVLKKVIEYARYLCPEANLGINTNISLLTNEMATFFKENNVDIITSLDGPREGNDLVRVFGDGKGTFDTVMEKIELFKDIKYPVTGFITTILDNNWDYIDSNFVKWTAGEGFTSMAIDVDLVSTMKHSPKECAKKLSDLHGSIVGHGMTCFGTWMNPAKVIVGGVKDGMPAYCKCIKGCGISVSAKGEVFTCSGSQTKLGEISDFNTIFNKDSAYIKLITRKLQTSGTHCDGCPLEAVCKSQCFLTAEYAEKTDGKRKLEMCSIYRRTTRYLLHKQLEEELLI